MAAYVRIQGGVTPEQLAQYKAEKKKYIQKTGEAIPDGQFLMHVLNEWAKMNEKSE